MVAGHEMKARMSRYRITQSKLAGRLGISQAGLCAFLQEVRPWPEGLEERALAELGRLEEAERAATEARDRVLADTT